MSGKKGSVLLKVVRIGHLILAIFFSMYNTGNVRSQKEPVNEAAFKEELSSTFERQNLLAG